MNVGMKGIRIACLTLAAGLCAGSARAHVTLAAWDGFSGVTDGAAQHGITLSLQGNTVAADGSVTSVRRD